MQEQKNNKGLIVTLIVFIIISLSLVGYIAYDKGYLDSLLGREKVSDSKKEEITETEEQKETKKLTLDDKEIQNLYNKIKSVEVYDQKLISKVLESKKEIIVKDLGADILNYYGYRNLKVKQLENDLCKNYPNILVNSQYICNNSNDVGIGDDATNNSTNVITEQDLKDSVEEIFGKGSYQQTEILEVSWDEYYVYDLASKKYVDTFIPGGGTDISYEKELSDIKQSEDSLSLIESIKFEDSLNEKISYNYKIDDDNYFLYSISLVK